MENGIFGRVVVDHPHADIVERLFPFLFDGVVTDDYIQVHHVFPGEEQPFHLLNNPGIKVYFAECINGIHYTYYAPDGTLETFYSKLCRISFSRRIVRTMYREPRYAFKMFDFYTTDEAHLRDIVGQINHMADLMTKKWGVAEKHLRIGPYKGNHRVEMMQQIRRNDPRN